MNRIKCCIPNIITFSNLSLGIMAILIAFNDGSISSLKYSCLLIMIAAVTDRLDGQVARLFRVTSDFGKELDSLSDLISFGVAPTIIAWKISLVDLGVFGYMIALLFVICGAYRLARFNISEFKNVFKGLPITIAGSLVTIVSLYNCFAKVNQNYTYINSAITAAFMIVLSFLMVSTLSFKKI